MIAFDETGTVRWIVANDEAQIATADGGVIGKSGITYDQNGSATGQVGKLLTQSWLGNAYQVGSVELLVIKAINAAVSYWPFQGGNPSGNSTAVKQPLYAPLPTCKATPGCIGQREAIYNALDNLAVRLADPTVRDKAQTAVFNKLGNDASGNPLTTASFIRYLKTKRPGFYDGLRSQFCNASLTTWRTPCWPIVGNSLTVEDYFKGHLTTDAETGTPSNPLLIFFRPSSIVYESVGQNLGNEGLIFHEALHGMTGKYDLSLLGLLGYQDVTNVASCNITTYIQQRVLQYSNGLDPVLINAGSVQCPLVAVPTN